jgi:hypothetical protein
MTEEIKINRPTNIISGLLAITLSGFLALMNISEWYIVKIQNLTSEYPFGGEGPTPYYYQTAELYSRVNLIWGLVFLSVLLFTTWTVLKDKRNLTLISLGTTLLLLVGLFINGQIGAN